MINLYSSLSAPGAPINQCIDFTAPTRDPEHLQVMGVVPVWSSPQAQHCHAPTHIIMEWVTVNHSSADGKKHESL